MIKMRNKKGTVLFALFPGAGHMFNGFMKLGISFMLLFFIILALAAWANMSMLAVLLPAVWFWAFMDCINRRFVDEAEFYAQEDQWLFEKYYGLPSGGFQGKGGLVVGIFLVLVGLYAIWRNCIFYFLPDWVQDYFWSLTHNLPEVILSIIVIVVGILLIRGRRQKMLQQTRQEAWQNDDFNDAM